MASNSLTRNRLCLLWANLSLAAGLGWLQLTLLPNVRRGTRPDSSAHPVVRDVTGDSGFLPWGNLNELALNGDLPVGGELSHHLEDSVMRYFRASDPHDRSTIATEIHQAAAGSIEQVATALRSVQLWSDVDVAEEELSVDFGPGRRPGRLRVLLPADYDAKVAHPLILAFFEDGGRQLDPFDAEWLDEVRSDFVVALPASARCATFHAPAESAADPRDWLRSLRRRYHIDSERVYIYGSGVGGDAAFNVVVMHADAFASAIIREGMLAVPYRRELLPLLLPNLRHTPTHLVWTQPDLPPGTTLQGRDVSVAVNSLMTMQTARRQALPISETVLTGDRTVEVSQLRGWLDRVREQPVRRFSHRFRYPGQGRACFLRQSGFTPPVWTGDQIDVAAQPHVSASSFTARVAEDKLALLQGVVQGREISITSAKCEAVELHLGLGDVDLSVPVRVRYNGKRRFDGLLPASITTLLKSAYDDWELQHPACVRLRVGKKGRVLPF